MKKVSLETISNALGISKVTVHKALTGQQGVSADLKNKIVALANELGYVNPSAAKQNCNFTFLVNRSFMLSENEQFYTKIFYYLNDACRQNNSSLQLVFNQDETSTLNELRLLIKTSVIQGIFIAGQVSQSLLSGITTLGIDNIVCIDFYSGDYDFNYIYVDNYYAGYTVAKNLIRKGHKKIGFVGDIKATNSIADRYFGYMRALNKYNIGFENVYHINKNIEHSDEPFSLLPVTAYICHCDKACVKLYTKLRDSGLSVPDDVSVVGFDNTDICAQVSPKLSSYGIRKDLYAIQALDMMKRLLKGTKSAVNYFKMNLEFFERNSIKDLKDE